MKSSTLFLKSFSEYEQHLDNGDGRTFFFLKKRVIVGRFELPGRHVHVPLPVFDYAGNMLATPDVRAEGDHLVTRFDVWRLFDVLANRYLPIELKLPNPGSEEVVTLVNRYIRHARELDDEQLAEWAPKAAAQLGVRS